jgi:ABC-type multidrug transport system fused ATPase/permease subunit
MRILKTIRSKAVWQLFGLSLFIGYLSFSMSACSGITCPLNNTVYTIYHIKNAEAAVDTLRDTLSVSIYKAGSKDTLLLLNRAIGVVKFNLPISYDNDVDTLLFNWSDSCTDTVWVAKTNTPHFESVECSATFFHEITSVRSTHKGIDTIVINRHSVNYDATKEHFHIRFKAHP